MANIRVKHIGKVTDNEDPEKRGRIKVACASLCGVDDSDEPVEYPVWIEPVFNFRTSADGETGGCGFFGVPAVGTTIEFEITEDADHDQSPGMSSIANPDPRYTGALLNPGDSIGSDFESDYPYRIGWLFPDGAVFYFDHLSGKIALQTHGFDGDKRSFLMFDEVGSVVLATYNGTLPLLNAETKTIVLVDGFGNMFQTAEEGFHILSNKGTAILGQEKNVTVLAPGQVLLNASHVEISAGSVNLGANAAEAVIKGNTFQGLFNAHTHNFVGNLGIPGVSLTPTVPLSGAELSTVVSTE